MSEALATIAMVGLPIAIGITWALRWGPPRSRWGLLEVLAAFGFFVGSAGLSGTALNRWLSGDWVPSEDALLPGVLGTGIASILVTAIVLRRATLPALGIRGVPTWAWGAAAAGVPLFLAVSATWAWLVELLGWGFVPQHMLSVLGDTTTMEQLVIVGYGAVVAPLVEELLFRGFLVPPLLRRGGEVSAIVAAGAIFGMVHMADPFAVVPLVVLGMGLTWLRIRAGTLWPGVVVHVVNNTIALLLSLAAAGP